MFRRRDVQVESGPPLIGAGEESFALDLGQEFPDGPTSVSLVIGTERKSSPGLFSEIPSLIATTRASNVPIAARNGSTEMVRTVLCGLAKKVYSLYDIATARWASYSTRVLQEDCLPAQAGAAERSEQRFRESACAEPNLHNGENGGD